MIKTPQFDADGNDDQTFAPFEFQDARNTEAKVIYLQFSEWDWWDETYGTDVKDGYYLDDFYINGYGIQGLVKAALLSNGINPNKKGIDYNSESGTCLIEFTDMNQAVQTAELAAQMITNPQLLQNAIKVAREKGFDDV